MLIGRDVSLKMGLHSYGKYAVNGLVFGRKRKRGSRNGGISDLPISDNSTKSLDRLFGNLGYEGNSYAKKLPSSYE